MSVPSWQVRALLLLGAALVALRCTPNSPLLQATPSTEALSVLVLQEELVTLKLSNQGGGTLVITGVLFEETPALEEGPQYWLLDTLQGVSLSSGEEVMTALRFVPRRIGASSALVSVTSSGGSLELEVSGTGLNNPPSLVLADNAPSLFCAGVPSDLSLEVQDVEDAAALQGLAVVIESDLEGELFRGTPDEVGALTVPVTLTLGGSHVLLISVEDSAGAVSTQSLEVEVDDLDIDENGVPDCAA